jgi:hypothetical protein
MLSKPRFRCELSSLIDSKSLKVNYMLSPYCECVFERSISDFMQKHRRSICCLGIMQCRCKSFEKESVFFRMDSMELIDPYKTYFAVPCFHFARFKDNKNTVTMNQHKNLKN